NVPPTLSLTSWLPPASLNPGSRAYRHTGTPAHRLTGSPAHRHTGTPAHRLTGSPAHQSRLEFAAATCTIRGQGVAPRSRRRDQREPTASHDRRPGDDLGGRPGGTTPSPHPPPHH